MYKYLAIIVVLMGSAALTAETNVLTSADLRIGVKATTKTAQTILDPSSMAMVGSTLFSVGGLLRKILIK